MSHVRNRRRRNIKRGFVSAHTWGDRAAKRDAYRTFWLRTMRVRRETVQAAAAAAREAEDAAIADGKITRRQYRRAQKATP